MVTTSQIVKMNALRTDELSYQRIAEQLAEDGFCGPNGAYSKGSIRRIMIKHEEEHGPVRVPGTATLDVGVGYIRFPANLTEEEAGVTQCLVDCLKEAWLAGYLNQRCVRFVGIAALCDAVGVGVHQEDLLMSVIKKIRGARWHSLTLGKGGGLLLYHFYTGHDGHKVFDFKPATILLLANPDDPWGEHISF